MKTIEEARRRWETLFSYGRNTYDLKQAIKSEDDVNPCEDGLRSVCWKVFLLCEDCDQSGWTSRLSDTRSAYGSLKDHFLKYIKHPNNLQSAVDPLAEDDESPWQALRRDEATRAEIYQDVERCLQDNYFFREPSTKSMMLDILFVYSKLNPDLGYRQGMHELLAPIIWVVERDAVAIHTTDRSSINTTDGEDIMLLLLDANYIESDAFNLFCSIMQVARSFYEHTDNGMVNGQPDVAPIVGRSQFIHNELLMTADHELAAHLNNIEILPQIFLTRWIRLLFGREFSFDDTLLIWDLLFANGLRASLIDHICVAMLLRIRWQLLQVDYSSALTLLLRYPTPRDYGPQTFVRDGLYLEQNLSPARGAFLVSKYSGRPPVFAKDPTQPLTRDMSPKKGYHRSHSRNLSEASSSGLSPAINSQRTLESLFQDVSEGLQRRTEGWGVAKAVRGAVTEAKRNMANAEVGSMSPSRGWRGGPRFAAPKLEVPTKADPVDLVQRVASLKKRDRGLATMLSEALRDLESVKEFLATLDAEVTGSFEKAVEKITNVHKDLQGISGSTVDRSMPKFTEDQKRKQQEEQDDEVVDEPGSVQKEEKQEVEQEYRKAVPPDANRETGTHAEEPKTIKDSENLTISKPLAVPVSPPVPAESPRSTPFSLPRRPLAQSEFSWMLGENTHRSSFVSSASLPPDQSRHSESQSRQGSLFGDGRDEIRDQSQRDEDSLSLNSFT